MPRKGSIEETRRRARRADRALDHAAALCVARAMEAKRAREMRQTTFAWKRVRTVQKFGTGVVVTVSVPGGGDERARMRRKRALVAKALARAGYTYPRPVVTPEWIAEDKRDEAETLSWMALSRKAL